MHAPRQMKIIYEGSLIDSHFWMQCCPHCLFVSALLIEVLTYTPCFEAQKIIVESAVQVMHAAHPLTPQGTCTTPPSWWRIVWR